MQTKEDFRTACAALAAHVYGLVPVEVWKTYISVPLPKRIYNVFDGSLFDVLAPMRESDFAFLDTFLTRLQKEGVTVAQLPALLEDMLMQYGDKDKVTDWYQKQQL